MITLTLSIRFPWWTRLYLTALMIVAVLGGRVDPARAGRRIADATRFVAHGPMPRWRVELMWVAHNLIAHPVSEITHWLGFLSPTARSFGLWLHDATIPPHAKGTGRG